MYTDLTNYTPGVLFGNDALVAREGGTESSQSGFFDYLDRGVSSLSNIAREYFAASAAQQAAQAAPERTNEYQFIPRDFGGAATGSGGVAVSWQVVALVALAGFAWFALKGNG